ncbi:MAG: tRNA glutamyl-Q(34) synthetase GluQRS [Verrucomicrobia bacterium]|nr:tRNA glutamyl-Q(34) synthetase GluQRS [Verrucomicrobiota bacterium]
MYRGRLAPSPTGWMHLGHARTFWIAQERAVQAGGRLILRDEDLDPVRSRPEFSAGMIEDLRWFGLRWDEGPDVGGACGSYHQSERAAFYRAALEVLGEGGHLYPCLCSRQDVLRALSAPHAGDQEPIYPGTCRNRTLESSGLGRGTPMAWRFRVPEGLALEFEDGIQGRQRWVCGKDFGDFVVWRPDDVPSYQLAVVVDDAEMAVTEVVRGCDLLESTARQILLYRALGHAVPRFAHVPLMTDEKGLRLAKRHAALSLRTLRARGWTPERIRQHWDRPGGIAAMMKGDAGRDIS